jgi:hypothetical protein
MVVSSKTKPFTTSKEKKKKHYASISNKKPEKIISYSKIKALATRLGITLTNIQ